MHEHDSANSMLDSQFLSILNLEPRRLRCKWSQRVTLDTKIDLIWSTLALIYRDVRTYPR